MPFQKKLKNRFENVRFFIAVYAENHLSVWRFIISLHRHKKDRIRRITPLHFALAVTVIMEIIQ